MIATDIDGTIMDYNFECSPAVKDCIRDLQKRGVKVVLATGRMHSAAVPVARDLKLDTPLISYQGGFIKTPEGELLYERTVELQLARRIIDWAKANDVHLNVYMHDSLFVEQANETTRRYTCERHIPYNVCDFDELDLKNVNKILAVDFEDAARVTSWVDYLWEEFPELYVVKSTPYFCEISNPEATKGHAVEFLRKHWGFKREEVLTIGDQDNDIELLKAGGIAVAMGNATPELKKLAHFITDPVYENGFVKAVEKFIA